MSVIDHFDGEHRFLSNFYLVAITYEGVAYPSTEHAFQAAKTLDVQERRRVAALAHPSAAKRAGRQLALRRDWEQVKLTVMEDVLRLKFQGELAQKLLDTRDRRLVEGNTWNDCYWGVCGGVGENHLGRLLMKIRSELSQEKP